MNAPQENILSRRTVYRFLDKEVPEEMTNLALKAASCAPCHKHTHPWKFYSIGEKSRELLIPLITKLAKIKSQKRGSKDVKKDVDRAISKIQNAPILFAITSKLSRDDAFREKEDYAATVCALHNMVLSLWANGIGSLWSTGAITRDEETYRILGINQNKEEIIGFIRAGFPASIPTVTKPTYKEVTTYLD